MYLIPVNNELCRKISDGTVRILIMRTIPPELPLAKGVKAYLVCNKGRKNEPPTVLNKNGAAYEANGKIFAEFSVKKVETYKRLPDESYDITKAKLKSAGTTMVELVLDGKSKIGKPSAQEFYGLYLNNLTIYETPVSLGVFGLETVPNKWRRL